MPRKTAGLCLTRIASLALSLTTLHPRPSHADLAATCSDIAAQEFRESSSASPSTFAPNGCDAAPVFTICDIRGDIGPCRNLKECSKLNTIIDPGCDDAATEATSCCTVSIWQPCTGCDPATNSCAQSCNFPAALSSPGAGPDPPPLPSALPRASAAQPPGMHETADNPDADPGQRPTGTVAREPNRASSPPPGEYSSLESAGSGDGSTPVDESAAARPGGGGGGPLRAIPLLTYAAAVVSGSVIAVAM